MNKPDWNDAPEWAKYLTFDIDGWFWLEYKPEQRASKYYVNKGKSERATQSTNLHIESRPA